MTSNQIKWIACLCMLIDHIGFLFFPQVEVLRWIGRLALPLFAYFIGEGCYYTSRPVWYFLRIFILGVVCQLFYTGQQLLSGNVTEIYLNILFTFSLSIPVCLTYLRLRESFKEYYPSVVFEKGVIFLVTVFLVGIVWLLCTVAEKKIGVRIVLDYGLPGVFLPLFAVLRRSPRRKRILYSIGVALFALFGFFESPYSLFSLLSIPILLLHNGKRGNKNWQYVFYAFYPLHFAALYLVDLFV